MVGCSFSVYNTLHTHPHPHHCDTQTGNDYRSFSGLSASKEKIETEEKQCRKEVQYASYTHIETE